MKDFKNFKTYKKQKKDYSLIRRKVFFLVFFASLLIIFFYAAYKGLCFLNNANTSKLKYIYIKGDKILKSNYLANSLPIGNNTKLDNQLKVKVYNNLIKNPFIDKARVAIIKPDTLYIDIKEKVPLCVLDFNNKQYVFSNSGQYITDRIDPQKINIDKILHIKMANLTPQINNKNIVLALVDLYKKLDKLEKISYIILQDNKFGVLLKNGVMVEANVLDCDYDKSIERLKTVWPKLLPDIGKIERILICYPDRIIIKWRTKEIDSGR